jgi:hypothetical protein
MPITPSSIINLADDRIVYQQGFGPVLIDAAGTGTYNHGIDQTHNLDMWTVEEALDDIFRERQMVFLRILIVLFEILNMLSQRFVRGEISFFAYGGRFRGLRLLSGNRLLALKRKNHDETLQAT